MATETQTGFGEETGSWTDAAGPLREQVAAHPWLGVAAALAAGAVLGALSAGGDERVVRVRVGRNEQVRIGYRLPTAVEEEDEVPEVERESRVRRLARDAGARVRHLFEEEEPTPGERLRRVGSAVRERVEEWAEDLPRPLRRRPRTLGERVKRAFR